VSTTPRPDPLAGEEREFWTWVAGGELRLQRCADCATFRHPPRPACAACGSTASEWIAATGGGEVWATTVIHPPTLPSFIDRTPYAAVVVRLDEGVFMVSNVLDVAPDDVVIGMRVVVAIAEVEPGLRLPLLRPSEAVST
jgi:uncharacterized protein